LPEREEKKICPLMTREIKPVKCRRAKCALWIRIEKPLANPFYKLRYEGCGLIARVPWELVKKEENKK